MKSFCKTIVFLSALFLTANVFAQKRPVNQKPDFKTEIKKTANMKRFILLVRFDSGKTLALEKLKFITEKWTAVVEKWTKQGNFIESFVLPQEGFVISGAVRKIDKGFALTADNFKVVSVVVLSANSLEEAVELAKDGANLDEGGSIEVREIRTAQTGN